MVILGIFYLIELEFLYFVTFKEDIFKWDRLVETRRSLSEKKFNFRNCLNGVYMYIVNKNIVLFLFLFIK